MGAGTSVPSEAQWQSELLGVDGSRLVYHEDAAGHALPDFSHAGYRGGEIPLPDASTFHVVDAAPPGNRDAEAIQAALRQAKDWSRRHAGRPVQVRLQPGVYHLDTTLTVDFDGVVLRGAGDDPETGRHTTLRTPAGARFDYVVDVFGGWDDLNHRAGTPAARIVRPARAGSRSVQVDDVSALGPLAPGDVIVLSHPCTEAWLKAVDYGGAPNGQWKCGPAADSASTERFGIHDDDYDVVYKRRVTAVDCAANVVHFDAPLFTDFDAYTTGAGLAAVWKWTRGGQLREVGIEDLRIEIGFDPDVLDDGSRLGREPGDRWGRAYSVDEDHVASGIRLLGVDDAWVRNVTVRGFTFSGLELRSAHRVTVQDVRAVEPAAVVTSPRRYNFKLGRFAQLVLFDRCYASEGRHAFVTQMAQTSGIVFWHTRGEGSITYSGAHSSWSQGLLFDNHAEIAPNVAFRWDRKLGLQNRAGANLTAENPKREQPHGWAATNSVAWNVDLGGSVLVLHRPPIGQNFAVGVRGGVSAQNQWYEGDLGYVEGTNRPGLQPASLYEAQLRDRLSRPPAQTGSGTTCAALR